MNLTFHTGAEPPDDIAPPTADRPLLELRGISKAFGATKALEGVDLSLAAGEIHGLCGQNGAGKSTLVKIISGVVRPDSGEIRFDGQEVTFHKPSEAQAHGVAIVDQELSVVPSLTVAENIRLGAPDLPFWNRRDAAHKHVRHLLARLGIGYLSPSARVETLSMPLRQLVEIARLLDRNAKVLVLDEPTASLSRGDSLLVFAALRELARAGHGVLYVSHRLDEVLDLCARVTVLRDGRRVAMAAAAETDHAALVNMIVGAAGSRAASSTVQQVEVPSTGCAPLHSGAEIVVDHVELAPVLPPVTFRVAPGEVLGLAGQVGSGATEILRSLAGLEPDAVTEVKISGRRLQLRKAGDAIAAGFHFVSNDRQGEGLFLSRSIGTNLVATRLRVLSRLGVVSRRSMRQEGERLYGRVGVRGGGLRDEIARLSGGNQQKVFIGRCLDRRPCRLLLLDEPTRGVDVGGRAEIHRLIRTASAEGASVIFSSGEPSEALALADRVITLRAGRIVATHSVAELTEADLLAETTAAQAPGEAVTDAL